MDKTLWLTFLGHRVGIQATEQSEERTHCHCWSQCSWAVCGPQLFSR